MHLHLGDRLARPCTLTLCFFSVCCSCVSPLAKSVCLLPYLLLLLEQSNSRKGGFVSEQGLRVPPTVEGRQSSKREAAAHTVCVQQAEGATDAGA